MLLIVFFTTTAISLLLFVVITYEFLRIHTKRIELVSNMPVQYIRRLKKGKKRMVILYGVSIVVLHVYTSLLLFIP